MAKNTTLGAEALLRVIKLKRAEVVALLLSYGQIVTDTTPDLEIAFMVTALAKKSQPFYNAFMKIMADKNVVTSLYASMDGFSNASGFYTPTTIDWGTPTSSTSIGLDCTKPENKSLALCSGGSTTSGTTTPKTKGSSQWLTTGLNLLQTGFNGYLQLDDNKTKRALAEASVKVTESGGGMGGTMGGNTNAPTTSHTGLYVVLELVGISVIGLVVYLATKKKA
jgi:hypothetical protein